MLLLQPLLALSLTPIAPAKAEAERKLARSRTANRKVIDFVDQDFGHGANILHRGTLDGSAATS